MESRRQPLDRTQKFESEFGPFVRRKEMVDAVLFEQHVRNGQFFNYIISVRVIDALERDAKSSCFGAVKTEVWNYSSRTDGDTTYTRALKKNGALSDGAEGKRL